MDSGGCECVFSGLSRKGRYATCAHPQRVVRPFVLSCLDLAVDEIQNVSQRADVEVLAPPNGFLADVPHGGYTGVLQLEWLGISFDQTNDLVKPVTLVVRQA